MSGMDRLPEYAVMLGRTNESLPEGWTVHKGDGCVYFRDGATVHALDLEGMLRELLAHRPASQAAIAPQKPVAWCASDSTGRVLSVSMSQYPWHPTPLYAQAAPAPSDGLREALERIAEQQMYRSGYDQTDISVEPVLTASEMQEIARAALSASPTQEGDHRHD